MKPAERCRGLGEHLQKQELSGIVISRSNEGSLTIQAHERLKPKGYPLAAMM